MVCSVFDVPRSSFYDFKQRETSIKLEEVQLRSTINELFSLSRGAAGSRTLVAMLKDADLPVGVFKVRRIMRDLELVCKQPGPHSYKLATVERADIPNILNREFDVDGPNHIWCGDISYIWTGNKWSYLAVIIDLFARRVVGWAMSDKPDEQIISDTKFKRMEDVAPLVRRKVDISIDDEYPELGVRSFGKGTFHKPVLNGIDVGSKKLYKIEPQDLLFSNVFAWEGAIAVVQPEDKGRVGSHRFISCVVQEKIATPQFLCFYLLSKEGIEKIREASPGGAGRNRTLGLKKLEKIEVPIPDYAKQLWFNDLQNKVENIKRAQKENETELEALMPSILDKAFKGELV